MKAALLIACSLIIAAPDWRAEANPPAKPSRSAAKPKPAPSKPEPPAEPPAPAEPQPPLLGYCAEPTRPDCIDSSATYADPTKRAACNAEMERYVRYVFSYRVCLNAEMERAVRETNEAIQRHKCHMAKGRNCP